MNPVLDAVTLLHPPKSYDSLSSIDVESKYEVGVVVIALDHANNFHCLFPITSPIESKRISRGFTIRSRSLVEASSKRQNLFLDLVWNNPSELRLFSSVLDELLDCVIEEKQLPSLIQDIVKKWDYLLGDDKNGLSENSIKGIFGEILLARALTRFYGFDFSPYMWTGPLGAAHDFELLNKSYEVKTGSSGSQTVRISSIYQLEEVDSKPLFLVHNKIRQDPSGESLHDLNQQMKDEFPHHYQELNSRMQLFGYREDSQLLHKFKYVFEEGCVYLVDSNFPSLIRQKTQIDLGHSEILDVEYTLNLANINPNFVFNSFEDFHYES